MKAKKLFYMTALVPLLIIFGFFAWFLTIMFEGESPSLILEPKPEFLSQPQEFSLKISDEKRGLRLIIVSVKQNGMDMILTQEVFPFEGLLNAKGVHLYEKKFILDPASLKLAQGSLDLHVQARDYSRRGGGDGNLSMLRHTIILDSIPPSIRAVSRMHNINVGGSGLVIYQTSSDTASSGLFVDDVFYPGFPDSNNSPKGIHHCYFALPHNTNTHPKIRLWARDKAGNCIETSFYYHIRKKTFRRDKMEISDRFIESMLPYFSSFHPIDPDESNIKNFMKINNVLREENDKILYGLRQNTCAERLWEGPWLRQKNSATRAQFADHRLYYYKGEKVDEKFHLGVDLASLANSIVEASNHGRVIYADRLGIYGLTVVLDHGQGLSSVYGHLSRIDVTLGQEVKKGAPLGLTGQTGLAGGDHLHFSIMVNGVYVNPIEWWDNNWIEDNINKKFALVK
ncbi:MAG: M23 family metallopeptidase [Deltaproteobacteria bacterium]|nr:M23 family metallopeptidase [Deltaproteobacteria bacterium]